MHGSGDLPDGVEPHIDHGELVNIKMDVSPHQPGGAPDREKPNDSVQTNFISKVCGIKGLVSQILSDRPAVLIVDFNDFAVLFSFKTLRNE